MLVAALEEKYLATWARGGVVVGRRSRDMILSRQRHRRSQVGRTLRSWSWRGRRGSAEARAGFESRGELEDCYSGAQWLRKIEITICGVVECDIRVVATPTCGLVEGAVDIVHERAHFSDRCAYLP